MLFLIVILIFPGLGLAAFQTEIHWRLCHTEIETVIEKMGAEVIKEKKREVAYLDTASRKWRSKGVQIRVRTSTNKIVSTIKIATSPEKVPSPWLDHSDVKCEWDLRSTEKSFICSLDNEQNIGSTYREAFSDEQLRFLEDFSKRVDFSELEILGPVKNKHVEILLDEKEQGVEKFVLERFVKGGNRLLELSTRVPERQSAVINSLIRRKIKEAEIELCEAQLSKSDWLFCLLPGSADDSCRTEVKPNSTAFRR